MIHVQQSFVEFTQGFVDILYTLFWTSFDMTEISFSHNRKTGTKEKQ